ncbi:hypothetical protein EMPG_13683 [Blastomyces silverae]|uniref:Phosphatidic acid phosphatase type 2/haloperoxidase domain-containing protein n=1 Tax=Blastomyces silverae TaxID=2060906 RepID=A0A0H1BJ18_9EURO|nr:hypothetical protein EMPG_13683 [Blastomyces silverae]
MAPANLLAAARRDWQFSKRLIASYVFDWVIILVTAGAARILKHAEPNRNPFSLTDPSISYPFAVHETVRVTVLVLVSLIVPAAIVFLGSIFFIPGLTAGKHAPKAAVWRRKLWEWNVGWMGLGIAYAGTYASTEALKVIYGKPRPDLLSRCNPNLSNIAAHVVGGLGERLDGAPLLVTYKICQNTSETLTWDGFVSFPSGHASCKSTPILVWRESGKSRLSEAHTNASHPPHSIIRRPHLPIPLVLRKVRRFHPIPRTKTLYPRYPANRLLNIHHPRQPQPQHHQRPTPLR